MIGLLSGEVIFSDGSELILLTTTGVGHQIHYGQVLPEGSKAVIFISHVVKEASEELYGFKTLRDKKMFELLNKVKGVGPKSAFNLVAAIGTNNIIDAITFENKKTLTKAPGIGAKAASQMILDLSGKVAKIKMYTNHSYKVNAQIPEAVTNTITHEKIIASEEIEHPPIYDETVLRDTLMACKELGFSEEKITPLAQKIMGESQITKPEQLIHLVLKEV